jgi:hypothetical protein
MIDIAGRTVVFIGRLHRLPRRLAARCVQDRGGVPRRSLTRATSYAVIGRGACAWLAGNRLQARLATARQVGAVSLGEAEFLRGLGLLPALPEQGRTLTLDDLARASGLAPDILQLLVLLDILESDSGRFAFACLGRVRTTARLLSEGAPLQAICSGWLAAASGPSSAAALVKRADGTIGIRQGEQVAELSGQLRLPLPEVDDPSSDDLFEAAELAEEEGDAARAEHLYRRCIDGDRSDPGAAFALANLLQARDRHAEARIFFSLAAQIDPGFAEAWYNLAHLLDAGGRASESEEAYRRALDADADYGDALFNAAMLCFRQQRYREAGELWERYLVVDPHGDWARRARDGLAYCHRIIRLDPPGR